MSGAYEINGVNNPTLIVRRGQTYTFNLNTAGHPFYLQITGDILEMWTKTIEKDLKAGGFKAHRHIASILKLMEYYENTKPDKPDYSTMSDEELLEIMSQSVLD